MTPLPVGSPPKHLGRFEVGAKIGGGGMATVFVGHAKTDDREEVVALKVIRDELAHDPEFTNMFVDEAKILARLSHENVIHTLEYGITGHHRFIAMELLSGRTFADVWDVLVHEGERIDLRLAAWICARVAAGLHSAHELVDDDGKPLNVIHRDVNPTNIFLTHAGEVKLIDFGLAKARVRVSKSADGIVKGKIPYLAPEQAGGKPIDRRIDVYALGTTLWEAATMKRLFKRDNDVDTLRAIRDAHVPDPRETIEGFPDEVFAIIERALRRDPDERYATADDMRRDLDAFVGDPAGLDKKLAELVSRLFPGGEAKQAKWLRDAAAVRVPLTMPPPAPVALASSSLLEDAEDEARPASDPKAPDRAPPRRKSEPPPLRKKKRPSSKKVKAKGRAKAEAKDKPPTSGEAAKGRGASKDDERGARAEPAPAPPEDTKKLVVPVAVAVAVLIVLAVLFSSR